MYFKILQRKCVLIFFGLENMKTYWVIKTQVKNRRAYDDNNTFTTKQLKG